MEQVPDRACEFQAEVDDGDGMDGTEGLKAIKEQGGITIAQDKATSIIYGMPRAAVKSGCVDKVLPLDEIPEEIVRILAGRDHG